MSFEFSDNVIVENFRKRKKYGVRGGHPLEHRPYRLYGRKRKVGRPRKKK